MEGSRLHWTLLLLLSLGGATMAKPWSPSVCDSRCVCYDDATSNLRAANCSNVHYGAKSFSRFLKDVQILRIHDGGNENGGGVFSESWTSCPNLEELYVGNNRQASLNARTLRNCKKLRVLDVSDNKISKVTQVNSLLKELPGLERLVLRGNPISALPDLTSSSLTSLDLSYCNLIMVGERTFAKLRKLHTLNLEGNRLRKFRSTLPGSLRVLNLVLNDIAVVSPVEHFSKLSVLELAGNPLQCSCDLVHLRNRDTAEFVTSRQEVTCVGPKTFRGLSWSQARKQCETHQLSGRFRRNTDDYYDLHDYYREGSGYGEEVDSTYGETGAAAVDGDNEIVEEDDDDDEEEEEEDSDPIAAPAEEKTESPDDGDETKLVDSKLSGTVEESDENAHGNVGDSFFETDHSTSTTTEHEFIPHESEADDDAKEDDTENAEPKVDAEPGTTGHDESGDTGSEKQEDKDGIEEGNSGYKDDIVVLEKTENSEVKEGEEEKETYNNEDASGDEIPIPSEDLEGDDKSVKEENSDNKEGDSIPNHDTAGSEDENINEESETDEESDNKDEDSNLNHDIVGSEDENINEESEKEEENDNKDEDSNLNHDTVGSEDENINEESEKEEDSDNKDEDSILHYDTAGSEDENLNKESETEKDGDTIYEDSILNYDNSRSEDENLNKESETEKYGDTIYEDSILNYDNSRSEDENLNKESKDNGEVKSDDEYGYGKSDESPTENPPVIVGDEVTEYKNEVDEDSADEILNSKWDNYEDESQEEEEIPPITAPDDDTLEDVVHKEVAVDVESEKKAEVESKTESNLDVAGFEGSGSDSEDAEDAVVTPSTKDVTVGHHGHRGRKLDLDVRKDGGDDVSQATTQRGPVVTEDGTDIPVVRVPDVSNDTSGKITLESTESPVTSTGSYVVLGLIMLLIVFLLGYAVYKSRLGRRRSDSDSRTIKEKDVELGGKGTDRELQDVSKPLLVTPPAAAVNGKSELQQPLVSKPTENPQLKDDAAAAAEDNKKGSPLQPRYHIYETLNGDKDRVEVPPPAAAAAPVTNATIPVTTSPKKSPSPTRVVSKLPRGGDSPAPNMYGGDENDDNGEVFLKNNQNGDLGSPRSCKVTVVQGDLSVPKKPVFVVNPGAPASNGVV